MSCAISSPEDEPAAAGRTAGALDTSASLAQAPQSPCLTAKQAAAYLHLNEKKLYELARRSEIPAARVGGKWLFPRALIDQWLLEQAHGGVLTDRLLITGSHDPLLASAIQALAHDLGDEAFVAYSPTDATHGLQLLARGRANISLLGWGSAEASATRHAALVRQHAHPEEWTCIRMGLREQGVMLRPGLEIRRLDTLAGFDVRWAMRPTGSSSGHFLASMLTAAGFRPQDCSVACEALDGHHAASLIVRNEADCAPGPRALATTYGLDFLSLGWEALDLVMPRSVFFRHLFQQLMARLHGQALQDLANRLGGYDLSALGRVRTHS